MPTRKPGEDGDGSSSATRRRLLAAAGAMTAVGVAGCADLGQRAFELSSTESLEAAPVALAAEDQEALRLAETARDDWTITVEGPDDGDVELTTRTVAYGRAEGLGGE